MLQYFAIAENEACGRMQYNLLEVRPCAGSTLLVRSHAHSLPLQKMIQPCGPPPRVEDD